MQITIRSRRRPRYGVHVCAFIAALLLLLSVSLLHTRLSQPVNRLLLSRHSQISQSGHQIDPLVSDDDDDSSDSSTNTRDDKIDELDIVEEEGDQSNDNDDDDDVDEDSKGGKNGDGVSKAYYFDHVTGSIRRALNKQSIDDWDYDYSGFKLVYGSERDKIKGVFGSDDVAVDEETRRKMSEVGRIEEALLLVKNSPLREKWGDWFDKKSEFLRRDKMFKSHLEVLNPVTNPLLQDPDGVGVTGLTRGDKAMQKWLLNELKRSPQLVAVEKKEPPVMVGTKRVTDRKTLDENSGHVFADGKRWGWYPGMDSELSFSGFMEEFFGMGKCGLRVFMVWNSPPWMFSVRHQRGIESLLVHHRDSCVLVFSETVELDFFKDGFVKDG